MMERLLIENFVGIKKLDIELKKINILIGPQASGKSVCAKLLFYIISSRCPKMSTEIQKFKNNFKRDYNATLTVKNIDYTHTIEINN
ncbi:MAG: AAA family ATPase [Symploca sp. SIO2B6]|nr:AAA family ATPase [Symploca sp. SIO2B6]